jgi:hypothetical protein
VVKVVTVKLRTADCASEMHFGLWIHGKVLTAAKGDGER